MITEEIVSVRTGKQVDYAYYIYLQNVYRNRTITDDERFDLELALAKFQTNSFYR